MKTAGAHHKAMVTELKRLAPEEKSLHASDSYTGSQHFYYAVPVPVRRQLVKDWLKAHKDVEPKEVLALCDVLFRGKSHEEKAMASYLLGYHTEARRAVSIKQLDSWLGELIGWAEIDALCQNNFTAEELLENWSAWETFLLKLSKSKNINKRRASLVFLVGPTWKNADQRLHLLAYTNIATLQHETDILITKAISWLLRSMVDTRKAEVAKYIEAHANDLPKIALRETRKKIQTGKKNS